MLTGGMRTTADKIPETLQPLRAPVVDLQLPRGEANAEGGQARRQWLQAADRGRARSMSHHLCSRPTVDNNLG